MLQLDKLCQCSNVEIGSSLFIQSIKYGFTGIYVTLSVYSDRVHNTLTCVVLVFYWDVWLSHNAHTNSKQTIIECVVSLHNSILYFVLNTKSWFLGFAYHALNLIIGFY